MSAALSFSYVQSMIDRDDTTLLLFDSTSQLRNGIAMNELEKVDSDTKCFEPNPSVDLGSVLSMNKSNATHVISPESSKDAKQLDKTKLDSELTDSLVLKHGDQQSTVAENNDHAIGPSRNSEDKIVGGEADNEEEEEESSNDESSYFNDPMHLPEPKSDRRFSWASNASGQPLPFTAKMSQNKQKASDASLSLSSDDSDLSDARIPASEIGHICSVRQLLHDVNSGFVGPFTAQLDEDKIAPSVHLALDPSPFSDVSKVEGCRMDLYPQQLTRMHSVNSLISNSSHNSAQSDTELRDVGVERFGGRIGSIPSGRLSPILGEHPPSRNQSLYFASPSTVNPGSSPPLILQASDILPGTYLHPQPHQMTSDQLSQWIETVNKTSLTSTGNAMAALSPASEYNPNQVAATPAKRSHGSGGQGRSESSGTRGDKQDRVTFREQVHVSIGRRSERSYVGSYVSEGGHSEQGFTVYWQRWLMLFYMSLLNLLSDWTCYSVAPIALLTEEAFGDVNAESLVTLFLIANAIASACEPMILARLGLRRTVLFGSLLLMIGSITKSGGMPPIIQADIRKGGGEWRVYLGFFIVGLSQPLYQCTPALLSASWFPEAERTMATSVALNANQIGIGFAFIFGTLLVEYSDDIPPYFGLLSILSTLAFLGTLIQFSDAPPTPPSDTAKVVRGTFEVNLPTVSSLIETMRNIGTVGSNENLVDPIEPQLQTSTRALAPAPAISDGITAAVLTNDDRAPTKSKQRSKQQSKEIRRRSSSSPKNHGVRNRRKGKNRIRSEDSTALIDSDFHGLRRADVPSSFSRQSTSNDDYQADGETTYHAPSPMMPGPVRQQNAERQTSATDSQDEHHENIYDAPVSFPIQHPMHVLHPYGQPLPYLPPHGYVYPGLKPPGPEANTVPVHPYNHSPYYGYDPYQHPPVPLHYFPYAAYYQQQAYQQGFHASPPPHPVSNNPYYHYYSYQHALPPPPPPHMRGYESVEFVLPPSGADEGAEPVLTITPHHLDITIRDDQILLSLKACLSRPGFIHSLLAFTVSGIAINTLSTFMDYLVRLNGAGREYTGIVGGSFQFVIMISSLIVGKLCDKTRAYYSITIGMLVLGAFGLAECGVSLDADRGNELRIALIVVAALVGPLQPVSTELGVDVVYPLSENTVLVIQQLFSNLLSAAFIPCFKAMRDIGRGVSETGLPVKPQYTFSFYLLIVLHAVGTVFFATFNGRYLRYEHEQDKLEEEEKRKAAKKKAHRALQNNADQHQQQQVEDGREDEYNEDDPLIV